MTDVNKLEELAMSKKTIEVNGVKIDVKPKKKDLAVLMTTSKDLKPDDAEKTIDTIINIMKRANPDVKEEVLEDFVLKNFMKVLVEILKLFGFEAPDLKNLTSQ